jgi:hypothetical protein
MWGEFTSSRASGMPALVSVATVQPYLQHRGRFWGTTRPPLGRISEQMHKPSAKLLRCVPFAILNILPFYMVQPCITVGDTRATHRIQLLIRSSGQPKDILNASFSIPSASQQQCRKTFGMVPAYEMGPTNWWNLRVGNIPTQCLNFGKLNDTIILLKYLISRTKTRRLNISSSVKTVITGTDWALSPI